MGVKGVRGDAIKVILIGAVIGLVISNGMLLYQFGPSIWWDVQSYFHQEGYNKCMASKYAPLCNPATGEPMGIPGDHDADFSAQSQNETQL